MPPTLSVRICALSRCLSISSFVRSLRSHVAHISFRTIHVFRQEIDILFLLYHSHVPFVVLRHYFLFRWVSLSLFFFMFIGGFSPCVELTWLIICLRLYLFALFRIVNIHNSPPRASYFTLLITGKVVSVNSRADFNLPISPYLGILRTR